MSYAIAKRYAPERPPWPLPNPWLPRDQPIPDNDNFSDDAHGYEKRARSSDARRITRQIKMVGRAVTAVQVAFLLDEVFERNFWREVKAPLGPPPGWILHSECPSPEGPTNYMDGQLVHPWQACLGGQSVPAPPWGDWYSPYHTFITEWYAKDVGHPDYWSKSHIRTWVLDPADPHVWPVDNVRVYYNGVNPNLLRYMRPQPRPDEYPNVPSPENQWEQVPSVVEVHKTETQSRRALPRLSIGPPPAGTKERKSREASAGVGVAIFRALDVVSEGAEVIDAFYEALPDNIRKRWEKNFKRDKGFSIDQAGQYGIDGADWKASALYHNWDKVDLNRAASNLIKNHLEDKAWGFYHRQADKIIRPRNQLSTMGF